MKKVLAMLIALMMVVALSAATVVISDAAEPATPTVADPASKVFVTIGGVETELNATTTQIAAGSGTVKFDAATGTVTLENATGIEKLVTKYNVTAEKATDKEPAADNGAGSVIIEVKGTNTIASASNTSDAANKNTLWIQQYSFGISGEGAKTCNLTIKGNGTLNVTGYQYVLGTQAGNTEITGDVTVNVTSHGQDAIHIGANSNFYGHDFIVSGNAKVNATTSGTNIAKIYRNGNGKGYLVVKDNADVKLTNPSTKSWGSALAGAGLKVLGGKLTVEAVGGSGQQSIVAIDLQKVSDLLVSEISGGKVVAKATSNFSTGDPRANTLFMKNVGGFKISGGVVELEANNVNAPSNPKKPGSNGCIAFQATVTDGFTMTGGELKLTSNDNVYGAFSPSVANMPINISGGKVTGSGNNFVFTYANGVALNITGGTVEYAAKNGIIGHYETHELPKITGSAAKVQAKLVETAGTLSVTAADFSADAPGTPGTVPPPTSDFAPIACVALGVMAMAAAAVVVIRKKVNG